MPFFLASRALVEIVQAASISPFWNQVGEVGILAQQRLLLLDFRDEIPSRLHVAGDVFQLAAAGDLSRKMKADAVIVERNAALELRVEQVLPGLRCTVWEGRGPIRQNVDVAVRVDDRIAVKADRLCKIRCILEVRQVGQILCHPAQCRLGGVGRGIPIDVDRRDAPLRHGRPDFRLDFVVLRQVVTDSDTGCLGEAVRHAGLEAVHPASAPGTHDDFGRLFRLLREGAAETEGGQARCGAGRRRHKN